MYRHLFNSNRAKNAGYIGSDDKHEDDSEVDGDDGNNNINSYKGENDGGTIFLLLQFIGKNR